MKNLSKRQLAFLVLTIIYIVGIIGIVYEPTRSFMVSLSPLNLLITTSFLVFGLNRFDGNFLMVAIFTFLFGFFIEVVGVKTGALFGQYYYGSALGWQLFDVPIIMGFNWFLLAFSASGVAIKISRYFLVRVLIASILMVLLDFFIEPVAVGLDFWNWQPPPISELVQPTKNFNIPLQNYLMWFLASLVVNAIIHWKVKTLNFFTCLFVLFIQFVFFISLNCLL